MSLVTNVILCMGILDSELEKEHIASINAFFRNETHFTGFLSIHDESLPKGWYGGNKPFAPSIVIGAINYLDLPGLLAHLRQIDWPSIEAVQLMIREDGESKFRLIDVFPGAPDAWLWDSENQRHVCIKREIIEAIIAQEE